LIHADFNDGNFTVDYSNGDITVFDFDDACYNWFMYDLACAWESGVGRTMFEADMNERKSFMQRYFDHIMTGYNRENELPNQWLQKLPFFLKMVEMDSLLEYFRYLNQDLLDQEDRRRMKYLVHCVKNEIPYLGFFDPAYSSKRPFTL
jgi:Ser/Thr protein kinase RdoA (MazF antagonist)